MRRLVLGILGAIGAGAAPACGAFGTTPVDEVGAPDGSLGDAPREGARDEDGAIIEPPPADAATAGCFGKAFGVITSVQIPPNLFVAGGVASMRRPARDTAYASSGQDALYEYQTEVDTANAEAANATPLAVPIAGGATLTKRNHPFTFDGNLSLVFQGREATGPGRLYEAKRGSPTSVWLEAVPLSLISTGSLEPWVVGDELFFGGVVNGQEDLYVSKRALKVWGTPTALGVNVNTADDGFPAVTADGLVLFFMSKRAGSGDIYESARPSLTGSFGASKHHPELSSKDVEDRPSWISPDGCTLWFTRREQTFTLWRASR